MTRYKQSNILYLYGSAQDMRKAAHSRHFCYQDGMRSGQPFIIVYNITTKLQNILLADKIGEWKISWNWGVDE